MRSFKLEVRGHTYHGTWTPDGAGRVAVRSDYGERSANLDGADPADVARAVLRSMVPRDQR
jgi:hypothetical protein